MTVLETLIVAGIIGVCGFLWRIQRELGSMNVKLDHALNVTNDHEERIRVLERQ